MLRSPLIHPPLLAALGAAGHGARVLIADANYSHSTNVYPGAARIHLNVRPGLVTVDQVLGPVIDMVPIESVSVMQPDDGSTPEAFGGTANCWETGCRCTPCRGWTSTPPAGSPASPCAWRPGTIASTRTCC